MLQQNFQAHEDQDGTAHHLRLVLILQAKDVAHLQAHGGEDEGDAADEQHRRRDIHPRQQGESDPHRQCIDAGGNRQGAKEASAVSSSLEKASFNILPPMTDSRMKATQ